jgi:hypothetical protein
LRGAKAAEAASRLAAMWPTTRALPRAVTFQPVGLTEQTTAPSSPPVKY